MVVQDDTHRPASSNETAKLRLHWKAFVAILAAVALLVVLTDTHPFPVDVQPTPLAEQNSLQ